MSVDVPRGTRTERLSVRVPVALKTHVSATVSALNARGLGTSTSQLVEMLVADGLTAAPDELETRLREWRSRNEEAVS